jgi:hypothetical protein
MSHKRGICCVGGAGCAMSEPLAPGSCNQVDGRHAQHLDGQAHAQSRCLSTAQNQLKPPKKYCLRSMWEDLAPSTLTTRAIRMGHEVRPCLRLHNSCLPCIYTSSTSPPPRGAPTVAVIDYIIYNLQAACNDGMICARSPKCTCSGQICCRPRPCNRCHCC